MDYTSSMVMRMLQTEDKAIEKELLKSQSIWLCSSCEMCISRCPMSIDIPKVMDYLRQKSVKEGLQNKTADKNIVAFHRSFLDMIQLTGRSYEPGMIMDYKLRSKDFFQDLTMAPKMFSRGKLPIFPESVKNRKNIQDIFKKSKKESI
jgi:heterodisulfide reductase subunit C